MSEPDAKAEAAQVSSLHDQLIQAVRDLWTMQQEVGDDYIVFMDRRRLQTRVQKRDDDRFHVSWEPDGDGEWIDCQLDFESPREAAFHAYQGPH